MTEPPFARIMFETAWPDNPMGRKGGHAEDSSWRVGVRPDNVD
jgi:hypothetical protein